MAESTHRVEVVRLTEFEPHPNADKLEIVKIWGYTCCVGKGQFKPGQLAAYIPPDSIVPDRPEYAFLQGHLRIKVKRLRGIYSQGLLVPAPAAAVEGQDVAKLLGITHYDPPEPASIGGNSEKGPGRRRARFQRWMLLPWNWKYLWNFLIWKPECEDAPVRVSKYDVEAYNRYQHLFQEGECVIGTEKIHGSNSRFVFCQGRMFCGSRAQWKRKDSRSIWWKVLETTPGIEKFCRDFPGHILYGEVVPTQELKYGCTADHPRLFVFDIMRPDGSFLDYYEAKKLADLYVLAWAPLLFAGAFDEERVRECAEGISLVDGANHIREGIVIRPRCERYADHFGRVTLKIVGNGYLEKA